MRTRADGILVWCSEAFLRLCGRSREQVEGQSIFDLLRFESSDQQVVRGVLMGQTELTEVPCDLDPSQGLRRRISLRMGSLPGRDGLEAIAQDVTFWAEERSRLREEVRRCHNVAELTSDCAYAFRITPLGALELEWIMGAFVTMTGYSESEIRSQGGWSALLHFDDRALLDVQRREVLDRRESTVEYRLLAKDGQLRRIRDVARPVLRVDGGPVVRIEGVLRDITERREMERALAESRDRYRALFENANAAIFIADAETGILLDANGDAERLVGRSRSELIGMHQFDLHPRQEIEHYRAMFRKHASAERVVSVAADAVRCDGTRVPVAIYGSHFELDGHLYQIGVFHDLTEQKRVEASMRKDHELREAIVDHAAEGITVCHRVDDPRTIAFTLWNDRMVELTGYTRDEINRIGWFEALWPDSTQRQQARERFDKLMAGQDLLGEVREVVRKDGQERSLSFSTSLFDADDTGAYVLALISDVTERERMLEQLRQSEKMEAIGQLAGGIAHDFNNQLAGIMGLAELMCRELSADSSAPDKSLARARQVIAICQRASDVTQQLLAFARRGRYRAVIVDLHEIVEQIVSILSHSIDKRIRLKSESEPGVATVRGDPSQIQNALLSIALNACDAMPEGGELFFQLDVQPCSSNDDDATKLAVVAITDSGTGMSKATRQRVFEPFFTTKAQGKGTGMGLAAAYGTVKNHGGSIDVDTALGQGSTFQVRLPYHPAPRPKKDVTVRCPQRLQRKGRILLVDDEPMVRSLLEEILRRLGHEVTTCADGQEAIERYRENWRDIDLVLLDMVMPRRGGCDVFRDMLEVNPSVQALLISGHAVDLEAQEVLALGAAGFLQKPFTMESLTKVVDRVLSEPPP